MIYQNLQTFVAPQFFVKLEIGFSGSAKLLNFVTVLFTALTIIWQRGFPSEFDRESMTPNPYLFIVIFIGVALVFPLVPLALAWLWRRFFQPPKPGPDKTSIYECGVESVGDAHIQFHVQYYLYAIIFLIFDVETVFLVPFAVAFTGLPVGAFIAVLVFLLLLFEGLVWAWGKGCLQWQR